MDDATWTSRAHCWHRCSGDITRVAGDEMLFADRLSTLLFCKKVRWATDREGGGHRRDSSHEQPKYNGRLAHAHHIGHHATLQDGP
jgi:hypothetical protein